VTPHTLAVKCMDDKRTGGYSDWPYPPPGEPWPVVPEPHKCGYNGYWVLTTRAQVLNWLKESHKAYTQLALCEVQLATKQELTDKQSATTGKIISVAKFPAYAAWAKAAAARDKAYAAWDKAYAAWAKAAAAWVKADAAFYESDAFARWFTRLMDKWGIA